MPKIRAGEIEIHYEIQGTGEPLLLISGLGYDLWMWHKMVPGLAEQFQVISFDNRGVGETDKPPGSYTAQMLAEDTAALLRALGIEQAAVMGHSMGGFIAQALVLNHPGLVSKLILSATNFGGPRHVPITPEAMAILTDMQSDPIERLRRGITVSTAPTFAAEHPEIIDDWVAYRSEHPIQPAAYQAQLQIGLALMAEAACFEHKLKDVQVPTLILFGAHDKVVPPGNADLLHGKMAGSRVKILPNAGHFFPFEAPGEAVAAVVEFLKG